jgi:hypothetical protein
MQNKDDNTMTSISQLRAADQAPVVDGKSLAELLGSSYRGISLTGASLTTRHWPSASRRQWTK